MKYAQLSKEQLVELHEEFSLFLASQQIDKNEWEIIKKEKPEVAQEEINIFSDLVWEKVLSNVQYLEHFSETALNLFKCNSEDVERIVVEIKRDSFNFLKKEDFDWFLDNSKDASIQYYKGQKPYMQERNIELFELIKKGAMITKGELFEGVRKIL